MSLKNKTAEAVKIFWNTRGDQAKRQGSRTGQRDYGARSAVTGGKQMKGFDKLLCGELERSGVDKTCIYFDRKIELPGFFRPEKKWDIVIVQNGILIAAIECKSHIGSFGNNFNNRTEEALGNATDIWKAYEKGAFKPSLRPWVGYLMLLEESKKSMAPTGAREPHFKVFPEFKRASYVKRYEILLTKLLRERLYDATCLILSSPEKGKGGYYREVSKELSVRNFVASLTGHVTGLVRAGAIKQ